MAGDSEDLPDGVSRSKWRWFTLFLMSTLYLGSCYVYDTPQALQTQLMQPPLNLSYVEFNALYSVYSSPNIVLPLIGGVVLKILGVKFAVALFALLVLLGQIIFSVGIYWENYLFLVFGRITYALGAESLSVAQSVIAVRWFSQKELTLVLGWNNSIANIGSTINILTTPMIYEVTKKLWVPCAFGMIVCLGSLFSALGFTILDKFVVKGGDKGFQCEAEDQSVTWDGFKDTSLVYWILCVYYFIMFISFAGFTENMNDLIHQRFGFTNQAAGQLGVLYYAQLTIVPPIIGKICDKYGFRAHWLVGIGFITLMGQILLTLLPDYPENGYIVVIPLLLLGFADAVFETATWACLLLVLDPEFAGIGFGFATAGMNGLNFVALILIGKFKMKPIQ